MSSELSEEKDAILGCLAGSDAKRTRAIERLKPSSSSAIKDALIQLAFDASPQVACAAYQSLYRIMPNVWTDLLVGSVIDHALKEAARMDDARIGTTIFRAHGIGWMAKTGLVSDRQLKAFFREVLTITCDRVERGALGSGESLYKALRDNFESMVIRNQTDLAVWSDLLHDLSDPLARRILIHGFSRSKSEGIKAAVAIERLRNDPDFAVQVAAAGIVASCDPEILSGQKTELLETITALWVDSFPREETADLRDNLARSFKDLAGHDFPEEVRAAEWNDQEKWSHAQWFATARLRCDSPVDFKTIREESKLGREVVEREGVDQVLQDWWSLDKPTRDEIKRRQGQRLAAESEARKQGAKMVDEQIAKAKRRRASQSRLWSSNEANYDAWDVVFSPSSSDIYMVFEREGVIKVIDAKTGRLTNTFKLPRGNRAHANLVCVSPDGGRLITRSYDRVVVLDAKTGALVNELSVHVPDKGMHTMCIAPSGNEAYSFGFTTRVLRWSLDGQSNSTDQPVLAKTEFEPLRLNCITCSNDGALVAVACGDGIRLIDAKSLQPVRKIESTETFGVAFSPDSRTIAGASKDGLSVWEVATGKRSANCSGHRGLVGRLAFSSDGRTLYSGGSKWHEDGNAESGVKVWDADNLGLQSHMEVQSEIFAFCKRSNKLVISDGHNLELWSNPPRTLHQTSPASLRTAGAKVVNEQTEGEGAQCSICQKVLHDRKASTGSMTSTEVQNMLAGLKGRRLRCNQCHIAFCSTCSVEAAKKQNISTYICPKCHAPVDHAAL